MYAHYALGIVGNQGQSVLYRVETGLPAVGQLIVFVELMLLAKLLPVVLLSLGEHQDDIHFGQCLAKAQNGAHQYRHSCYGQELLGNVAPHSQTLATGYDNNIIHVVLFSSGLQD